MKDTKQCVESRQLRKEGYSCEERLEVEDNRRAHSIVSTSSEKRNDVGCSTKRLLEKILERGNLNEAYKRVKGNKGKPGIDGMTVTELLPYLKENGDRIRQSILEGRYSPQPVRRVEIPKPDGGMRILGIPTVLDRMIEQAIAQVLSPIYEEEFSESSYGFRPKKNAHQAINKSREYIEGGYNWVVDIDLERYFDTVNHDKLMNLLSRKIEDGRVLSLIRKYLCSGVMINGVVMETEEGPPQGGNLSPLLGNIMLDELDKELQERGLKHCRYADDCNIYVRSKKAAERVMKSITNFIELRLKLKVNKDKSSVDRPWKLKYLGFTFYRKPEGIGVRIHPKSVKKFKDKLKEVTGRSRSMSMEERAKRLKQLICGWVNYFGITDMKKFVSKLDEWLRRRIRMCYWKQWKKIATKHNNLIRLGLKESKAWEYANTRKGYWRVSKSPILSRTLTNEHLRKLNFCTITERYALIH